ncbi:TRAP transporter small permease subunit [Rhodobium gokarnense]|uniref:TRAP transporter small permease protein n=1 Tax=Rhodobium gokarnense TaxID=364296 RepID=A0ABT3HCK0_9HYPH|nr:TRAP transporter small permease subunit [Rhodobium gokarnense]MCW2308120.1 TRAP-type mannitol/chloroaromatic compound transport system permease small subunit [Rhodobium gokarnense]
MGTPLAWLGLAGLAASIFVTGAAALWLIAGSAALIVLAALVGARPALVLLGSLAAVILFILVPDALPAVLKTYGTNGRSFFRTWENEAVLVVLAAVALVFWLAVWRYKEGTASGTITAIKDLDALVSFFGKSSAWLFVPLMVVIAYDVTQRKILEYYPDYLDTVFAFSSTKLQELEWHIHAVLFLFCLGYAYLKDAHVRIELVRDRLSPNARVWMELVGGVIFLLPYCYLVVKFGFTFAERAFATDEVSAAQTGLSYRWIIKAALPLGFSLFALAGISAILKSLVYLFAPRHLRWHGSHYSGTPHAGEPDDLARSGRLAD